MGTSIDARVAAIAWSRAEELLTLALVSVLTAATTGALVGIAGAMAGGATTAGREAAAAAAAEAAALWTSEPSATFQLVS